MFIELTPLVRPSSWGGVSEMRDFKLGEPEAINTAVIAKLSQYESGVGIANGDSVPAIIVRWLDGRESLYVGNLPTVMLKLNKANELIVEDMFGEAGTARTKQLMSFIHARREGLTEDEPTPAPTLDEFVKAVADRCKSK